MYCASFELHGTITDSRPDNHIPERFWNLPTILKNKTSKLEVGLGRKDEKRRKERLER